MNAEDLLKALTPVTERLISLASEDPAFRSQLRALAESILAATEQGLSSNDCASQSDDDFGSGLVEPNPAPRTATAIPQQASSPNTSPLPSENHVPLPELTFARHVSATEASSISLPDRWTAEGDDDLGLIAARCRVKAEASRWVITRHELQSRGANFQLEIAPRDRAIVAKAKSLDDCYLWMSQPNAPFIHQTQRLEELAGCFDTMADALELLQQLSDLTEGRTADWERLLNLLAEAQSSLRKAIEAIDGPTDNDQIKVFQWLKKTSSEQHVYLPRYMKLEDSGTPSRWADLSARIHDLGSHWHEAQTRSKHWKKLLGKVRHKLSLVASEPAGSEANWQAAAKVIDELIGEGLAPSHRELREMLVPVLDDLPEVPDLPQGVQLVLREVDRYLATAQESPTSVDAPLTSSDVQSVAELLRGRSVVLIGGTRREHAQHALQAAFKLKELVWVETREHESPSGFQSAIAQPDVALVLLAIRWASHSFGDIKIDCDRLHKPLVRLPRGYNPNQVATEILQQVSDTLESTAAR